MGVTALSTASTVGPSVGPQGRAFAHRAAQDMKERAVKLRALAPPQQTRARMDQTGASIASTAALLAEQLGHARAHVTQDTKERTARPRARAPSLRNQPRPETTATSTASMEALLVEPLACARARLATRDTKA